MSSEPWAFATAQIHAGQDRAAAHGSRVIPIHLASGFAFDDFEQARDRFSGDDDGYSYTRMGNPTASAVERKLAALEGGAEALLVGSGQAALTVAMLGLLRTGDHIVSSRHIYEGSRGLFRENLTALGITVDFVDEIDDPDAWRAQVRPETRVFFAESIANPRNQVLDVPAVAAVAHEAGVPLVVDNTFATPYLHRPLEWGADLVVHSTSKFLSGHGAALGGAVIEAGRFDWAADPARWPQLDIAKHGPRAYAVYIRNTVAGRLGPTIAPFNAFLLQQGIETLSLRVERHSANALAVARWLAEQPEVESVDYAGLDDSPARATIDRLYQHGNGSVFAFTVRGGQQAAAALIERLELFSHMSHLGDVRSLIMHPTTTSHARLTNAEREQLGVTPGMLRVSIGIEDADDLIRDLRAGLDAAARAGDGDGATHATHRALLQHAAVARG
ncbi:MAG TPA: aminotransferase class I/II-fold pyridoxal phosphate-dependent enzyme [Pseudolysinimonas sp.]|jgi:O-acetylhomoserine (thiol)-lyase